MRPHFEALSKGSARNILQLTKVLCIWVTAFESKPVVELRLEEGISSCEDSGAGISLTVLYAGPVYLVLPSFLKFVFQVFEL